MKVERACVPIPAERLAEASVWIARLHGEDRDSAMKMACRDWLEADQLNQRAFELATDVWEEAHALRRIVPLVVTPARTFRKSRTPWLLSAVAAAACFIAIMVAWVLQAPDVSTGVGEQRLVTLEDGTRVYLNTRTRLVVHYGQQVRRVELTEGEALFDVAKRADWPFIVSAGERVVSALGTSFVVRHEENRLAVTLVEGKVAVGPQQDDSLVPFPAGARAISTNTSSVQAVEGVYTLLPGERLTFSSGGSVRLDHPSIEHLTAWRRGQVILDDTSLADAAAEMNRYNERQIVIESSAAHRLLVSGLFQAGDSSSFARAVAQTHGLRVTEEPDRMILTDTP
jgi:transmembrane sensor